MMRDEPQSPVMARGSSRITQVFKRVRTTRTGAMRAVSHKIAGSFVAQAANLDLIAEEARGSRVFGFLRKIWGKAA